MYRRTLSCFDLEQIALSGQCFRMNPLPDTHGTADNHETHEFPKYITENTSPISRYSVISGSHYLELFQNGSRFDFDCPEDDLEFWYHYFDLNTNYQNFLSTIDSNDSYLMAAGQAGSGIRILHQDPWEMIITFIISQQKTIPKIKEAVELLSERFGSRMTASNGTIYYTFPTPEQLSTASLQDLLDLKLGYRAKYIERTTKDALNRVLDLHRLSEMPYEEAFPYLMQFYGIGAKVANCICLFGLHQIDAFPVDTWIQKILLREYYRPEYDTLPKSQLYDRIIHDSFSQYKGHAGVIQQYIFFYERVYKS